MPLPCPHCQADLGSGYLTQDTLTQRLRAKDTEIDRLKIDAARAELLDGVTRELETAKAELGKTKTAAERFQALASKGQAFTAQRTARAVEAVYEAEMRDRPEAERKTFGDWLNADAATHPMLGHLFTAAPAANTPAAPAGQPGPAAPAVPAPQPGQSGAAAAPAQGAQPAAPQGGPSTLPPSNLGAAPAAPPTQGPPSPSQLDAYLRSDEFRKLPKDQKDAKLAELKAGVNKARNSAPAV